MYVVYVRLITIYARFAPLSLSVMRYDTIEELNVDSKAEYTA